MNRRPTRLSGKARIEGWQDRQRSRINSGHQQLFGLLIDCVLAVAVEIGMRVRTSRGSPGPLRNSARTKQPRISCRTLRGLKIVHAIKTALPQSASQLQPAFNVKWSWPAIGYHLIEKAEMPGKPCQRGCGQQCDVIELMVPANSRRRSQRLDEIAERAEANNQKPARRLPPARRPEPWSAPRQKIEIDIVGEPFECGKNGGMRFGIMTIRRLPSDFRRLAERLRPPGHRRHRRGNRSQSANALRGERR